MPRRGNVPKREVLPDPVYGSVLVTKLVNSVMLDGKKGVAQKVVYAAFDQIKEKTEKDPVEVFTQAMENIMPSLEVTARRWAAWTGRPGAWGGRPRRGPWRFVPPAVRPWVCAG